MDDCRCRGSKAGHVPWVIFFFSFTFLNVSTWEMGGGLVMVLEAGFLFFFPAVFIYLFICNPVVYL